MGVTRATTSHGVRRTTSRLESLRTTASSTARPSAEAVDIAAATARRASAACIAGELHPRPGREELHRSAGIEPRPKLRAQVSEELARHRARGDDRVHQVGKVLAVL